MIIQSSDLSQIPGIEHGFGTLAEPIPETLAESWSRCAPVWNQAHGKTVIEVREPRQACGDTDALWTRAAGQIIAVRTADCVPILLARRDGKAVAAVHAGWRGTKARVLRALWEKLRAAGESPTEWVAAVGPAIGPCCYEVSDEIAHDFSLEFREFGAELSVPRARYLDLPAINDAELKALGIGKVDLIRACTRCFGLPADPVLHSYRREGGGVRQFSMIRAHG